jgi:hypothetical protein
MQSIFKCRAFLAQRRGATHPGNRGILTAATVS